MRITDTHTNTQAQPEEKEKSINNSFVGKNVHKTNFKVKKKKILFIHSHASLLHIWSSDVEGDPDVKLIGHRFTCHRQNKTRQDELRCD